MIKVKKISTGSKSYAGMELTQNQEYTIPTNELPAWSSDLGALTDALSGDIEVYSHDNVLQPAGSQAVDALKDSLPKKVQQTMGEGGAYAMRPRGFGGIALPSQNTTLDYQVTENLRFRGGVMYAKDASLGDTVNMYVVDKDNILGYGANFVLAHYVQNWQVMPNCPNIVEDVDLSSPLLAGLYFRLVYTNTHASNSVPVLLNLYSYVAE